jgi:hypothetical protein
LGEMNVFHSRTQVSVPTLLLALLLLNAGMNIRLVALREWLRNGVALTSGLVGNFFIPLLFVLALSQVMRVWHNAEHPPWSSSSHLNANRRIVDRLVSKREWRHDDKPGSCVAHHNS